MVSDVIDHLAGIVLTQVTNEFRVFAKTVLPVDIGACALNPKLAFTRKCFSDDTFVILFMKYQSLYVLTIGYRCGKLAKEGADANPITDWQLQFSEDFSKHNASNAHNQAPLELIEQRESALAVFGHIESPQKIKS